MSKIKLGDLIDSIDHERALDDQVIQICGTEWRDIRLAAPTCSRFLIPFYECEIECMESIEKGIIRVDIGIPNNCKWPHEIEKELKEAGNV